MWTRSLARVLVAAALAACGTDVERAASAGGQGGAGGAGGAGGEVSGGAGGAGGVVGAGGAGGAAGGGGQGSDCMEACAPGLSCCSGKCVNLKNDIHNCGACGVACEEPNPYCNQGFTCLHAPCLPETPPACDPGGFCCDNVCCKPDQLCCLVEGPGPFAGASCQDPVDGTCPVGCPTCD
ncbi:MAG TPA: hypothetical protein VE093_34660 [Polyangiaceae bacterium]|nr:hypothetical protein [Polyangiaceae bacterium]